MSLPHIPTSYSLDLSGGLDLGLDDIKIDITEIPKITTDSTVDLKPIDLRVTHLPKIEIEMSLKPTRMHVPSHYQMCFSILGMEMFKLGVCGETMMIIEPYVPHQTECCA
jgi:hypothetical protein